MVVTTVYGRPGYIRYYSLQSTVHSLLQSTADLIKVNITALQSKIYSRPPGLYSKTVHLHNSLDWGEEWRGDARGGEGPGEGALRQKVKQGRAAHRHLGRGVLDKVRREGRRSTWW